MTMYADMGLWANAWFYLSWVVPFLFVLSIVVFVHEMGHFLVARYFGVKVETFSIGFGHEIGGFYDRYGTRWRLAWIPLGGYVKFKGDDNAASVPSQTDIDSLTEEERHGNFHAKPISQRAAVVAAGPIANFILAIVILTLWFGYFGKPVQEPRIIGITPGSVAEKAGFKAGDLITAIDGASIGSREDVMRIVLLSADSELDITVDRDGRPLTLTATPELAETKDRIGNVVQVGRLGMRFEEPRIDETEPGGVAATAGLRSGDIIRKIDASYIESREDVLSIVSPNAGKPLSVTVERNGELITLPMTPALVKIEDRYGKPIQIGRIGVKFQVPEPVMKSFSPVGAFSESVSETYFWMKQPLIFIQKLVIGQASPDQVRGVVGIAQLSREVASISFVELFRWIAIISINIGLLNLFPIPLLDGGHLLFYGIEAIRGRPLRERTMEIGFRIGFALVIMLMLFALRNDVIHLLRQTG
jgi:regulator of sigma E protease